MTTDLLTNQNALPIFCAFIIIVQYFVFVSFIKATTTGAVVAVVVLLLVVGCVVLLIIAKR